MNIVEINPNSEQPSWKYVLILGLPLAVATVAFPLGFSYGYQRSLDFIARRPRTVRIFVWTVASFFIVSTIIVVVTVGVVSTKVG